MTAWKDREGPNEKTPNYSQGCIHTRHGPAFWSHGQRWVRWWGFLGLLGILFQSYWHGLYLIIYADFNLRAGCFDYLSGFQAKLHSMILKYFNWILLQTLKFMLTILKTCRFFLSNIGEAPCGFSSFVLRNMTFVLFGPYYVFFH